MSGELLEQWEDEASKAAAQKAKEKLARQRAGTPLDLYAALDGEYNFTLDACAEAWSALHWFHFSAPLPAGEVGYVGTAGQDALAHDWNDADGNPAVAFCNPPYDSIREFLAHGLKQMQRGVFSVFLVKSDTGVSWFRDLASQGDLHFICRRLKHRVPPDSGIVYSSANFSSMLVIFDPFADECLRVRLKDADGAYL